MTTADLPEPTGWPANSVDQLPADFRLVERAVEMKAEAPMPTIPAEEVKEPAIAEPAIVAPAPASLKMSRARIALLVACLIVTAGVAIAGFSISFAMLDQTAQDAGVDEAVSWLYGFAIDGAMIAATMVWQVRALLNAGSTGFAKFVVGFGCLLSMAAAGVHASTAHGKHMPVLAAAFIAGAPALVLAFTVHLVADLAHLFALTNERSPSESAQVSEAVSAHVVSAPVSVAVSAPRPVNELPDERPVSLTVSVERPAIGPSDERPVSGKASAQGGPPSDARKWIAAQLRAGKTLTGVQVGERFGKSEATGKRWLKAIRDELAAQQS